MLKHEHTQVIDPAVEPLITIKAVTRLPQVQRDGRAPHFSTIFRWIHHGIKVGGTVHYLETRRVGALTLTSEQAVDRFLAKLSGQPAPKPSPRQRETALAKIERELEAAGV